MADYIKREDLLDLYDLGGLEVENAKVPLNVVIQTIKDMPSADVVSREDYEGLELVCKNYEEALKDTVDELEKVERKRGEWYDRGSLSCRCSNCGCKATKEYSFCPNCGADMRGRKDDRG